MERRQLGRSWAESVSYDARIRIRNEAVFVGRRRRVHPLTVHTLLLYSPVGLDLKLAIKGLENALKLVA